MGFDTIASGQRIKQLRKSIGLTQEQFSEQINISVSYLSRLEAGQYGGSIDLLIDIAAIFDTSLDYLILGKHLEQDVFKQKLRSAINLLTSLEHDL